MLSKLKANVPKNLISLAKKTPKIPVAIVCANHSASINSAKEASNMDLIDPIFIGEKNIILEEANNGNLNHFNDFLKVLEKPYKKQTKTNNYQFPAPSSEKSIRLFVILNFRCVRLN